MSYQFVREPLTSEEADRLYAACTTQKEKLVIWTLLETGLRISELCSLTADKVQWQQKSLRIEGKGGIYGKRSKKRVVPMSDKVFTLLSKYFSINDEWFIGVRCSQKLVKQVANRAKIIRPVTPHVLRHTFACTALQKGISTGALKKIMGHNSITVTEIYLNLTDIHLSEEFERKW